MIRMIAVATIGLLCVSANAQSTTHETDSEVLQHGEIVAGNILTAIKMHLVDDPTFQVTKQIPEDARPDRPKILVKRDGKIVFDWTPGQEARYLMETIRQGLHAIQSSGKPRGIDAVALAGGREYWPKLRDISCHDAPSTRYYDLDGFEQYCPDK
jgi:hypothetical protein